MLIDKEVLSRVVTKEIPEGNSRNLLQIGAHKAEEHELFEYLGIERFQYVEPLPEICDFLRARFLNDSRVQVFECAITLNGNELKLIRGNPTYISSFLELNQEELKTFPELHMLEQIQVETRSLTSLIDDEDLKPNILVLDVQGFEVNVLKSGEKSLGAIKIVILEYLNKELYLGAPTKKEVLDYLESLGFVLVAAQEDISGLWGDAIFVRKRNHIDKVFEYFHRKSRE